MERKKKWRAEVRRNHRYIGKTFLSKGHASKWVKDTELKLEKEQYEDFRDSAHLSLGNLIARYRDEITPNNKVHKVKPISSTFFFNTYSRKVKYFN